LAIVISDISHSGDTAARANGEAGAVDCGKSDVERRSADPQSVAIALIRTLAALHAGRGQDSRHLVGQQPAIVILGHAEQNRQAGGS
jgi:hypothetical protein